MDEKKCIMCGYHCTKAPCEFGEWDEVKGTCAFLLEPNEYGQRLCGKYDEIIASGIPHVFGAGCPATLFNTMRQKVLERLNEEDKTS